MNGIPPSTVLPDTSSWFITFYQWVVSLLPGVIIGVKHLIGFFVGLSIPLSLFFLIGIIYCVEKLKKIRDGEEKKFDLKVEPAFEVTETGDTALAHRWENATKFIESENPNDWKQSIIESDIILDDLLTKMGYQGATIGEKLDRVATGDMKSLAEAKHAHWVRNRIAHDGSSFNLNHHEAKQVYHEYRKVLEEFYYI